MCYSRILAASLVVLAVAGCGNPPTASEVLSAHQPAFDKPRTDLDQVTMPSDPPPTVSSESTTLSDSISAGRGLGFGSGH